MPKQALKNPARKRAATGRPFQKGKDARRNTTKAGPGRKPDAFKQMCRALASSAEVEKTVRDVLKDPKSPAFVGALKWATENGYGKPEQPITGVDGGPIEIRVSYDKGGPAE